MSRPYKMFSCPIPAPRGGQLMTAKHRPPDRCGRPLNSTFLELPVCAVLLPVEPRPRAPAFDTVDGRYSPRSPAHLAAPDTVAPCMTIRVFAGAGAGTKVAQPLARRYPHAPHSLAIQGRDRRFAVGLAAARRGGWRAAVSCGQSDGPRAAACRPRRVVDLHALAGGLSVLPAGELAGRRCPAPFVWGVLALCTSSTAWLWLAARGLFDDRFRWDWPLARAQAPGMVALGLRIQRTAARRHAGRQRGPRPRDADATCMPWPWWPSPPLRCGRCFAAGATIWSSRAASPGAGSPWASACMPRSPWSSNWPCASGRSARCCRRCTWPGIGIVALALAVLVARRSLDAVLGLAARGGRRRSAAELLRRGAGARSRPPDDSPGACKHGCDGP